jgi:hypothetical protein
MADLGQKVERAVVKTKPTAPARKSNLVVIPPRLDDEAHAVTRSPVAGRKHPLTAREHSRARDISGKATRAEIRREAPRVSAPRTSAKPAERGGQQRSKKAGKK